MHTQIVWQLETKAKEKSQPVFGQGTLPFYFWHWEHIPIHHEYKRTFISRRKKNPTVYSSSVMIQMNTFMLLCNDEVPTVTHSPFFTEKPQFRWLCSLCLWLKDQQLKGDRTLAQHSEETCSLIFSFFHQSNILCKVARVSLLKT